MRIHHKTSHKKPAIILALIVVALVASYAAIAYYKELWPFVRSSPAAITAKNEDSATKSKTDAEQKASYLNSVKDTPTPSEPAPVPTSSDTIDLTATQQQSDVVVITKLTGSGYSQGTCTLTATNGSKSVSKTADIIYQPEYSTCAGYTIPTSSLGAGTWKLSLKVSPLNGSDLIKEAQLGVK